MGLIETNCDHCGDSCIGVYPKQEAYNFCCNGCMMVWNLLHDHNLENYYKIEDLPGTNSKRIQKIDYGFLDNEDVQSKLISFSTGTTNTIFLSLPDIHCTACIWLLEHLNKLEKGIIKSRVNFLEKSCTIVYENDQVSLKELIELLAKIGYPPHISLDTDKTNLLLKEDRSLIIKIGISGFCFGNIMLLSFPDYFGQLDSGFFSQLSWIIIILSLPVLFYTAQDYYRSAWNSLRMGEIGIDIPIVIGASALFLRSIYEILSHSGPGYLDSFTGFIFFLLIGRWFQKYTYHNVSFNRDYRSFLPLSIKTLSENEWIDKLIDEVKKDDIILVRTGEIIPSDGILVKGLASIDYSFITGESHAVNIDINDVLSAGGKQLLDPIEIKVTKPIEESKLTELWKADIFKKTNEPIALTILDNIGRYFTIFILSLSIFTLAYWMWQDPDKAILSFTAVLIIACPCVLALSFPFIFGNALRLLTKNGVFSKNPKVLFELSTIDTIVFDKTGTLTDPELIEAKYHGKTLTTIQKKIIKSVALYSHHPLSQSIAQSIESDEQIIPDKFEEKVGKGLMAKIGTHTLRMGSTKFIKNKENKQAAQSVMIEWDSEFLGYFYFSNQLRKSVKNNIKQLEKEYNLAVLSGDLSVEKTQVQSLFKSGTAILFKQSPQDKLNYIKELQSKGHRVMMIGDGLNDAGALLQSEVGAVISRDNNYFTPASDLILNSESFEEILAFLKLVKRLKKSLYVAFVLAFIYNTIGLLFAVSGRLTPIVAAILMPLSSITIVIFGLITSYILYYLYMKK